MEDTTNDVVDNSVDTSTSQVNDDVENKDKSQTRVEVKSEKAEGNTSNTNEDDSAKEFEKTGNAVLDFAIDNIADMGFKPNDPAVKLAYEGNFDLLRAEMAKKGAKGWEQIANLLEKGYKEEVEKHEAFHKSIEDAIDQTFDGDKDYKDRVFAFAKENASEEEAKVLNGMLDQSPFAAKIAMSYLKNAYELSNTKTQQPAQAVTKNASPPSNPNSSALSPDDFYMEVNKLAEKVGRHSVYQSKEYATLVARRQAYR